MAQRGEPVESVEAFVEYSWRCPKCGKFNGSQFLRATCNQCLKQVCLFIKDPSKPKR